MYDNQWKKNYCNKTSIAYTDVLMLVLCGDVNLIELVIEWIYRAKTTADSIRYYHIVAFSRQSMEWICYWSTWLMNHIGQAWATAAAAAHTKWWVRAITVVMDENWVQRTVVRVLLVSFTAEHGVYQTIMLVYNNKQVVCRWMAQYTMKDSISLRTIDTVGSDVGSLLGQI